MAAAILDHLKRAYHLTWWALVLRGVAALALGIFIYARPLESVAAFALVIAFWAIFSGTVDIVHAFELRPIMQHWWALLLSGVLGVGFGIAALAYYPVLSLTFAVLWVTWYLMLSGILGIYAAMVQRKLNVHWGSAAAFGTISILAAAFALVYPPATLAAIMGLMAGVAIVVGIALIAGAFKIRSLVHRAGATPT